jgi:hypothetical protein
MAPSSLENPAGDPIGSVHWRVFCGPRSRARFAEGKTMPPLHSFCRPSSPSGSLWKGIFAPWEYSVTTWRQIARDRDKEEIGLGITVAPSAASPHAAVPRPAAPSPMSSALEVSCGSQACPIPRNSLEFHPCDPFHHSASIATEMQNLRKRRRCFRRVDSRVGPQLRPPSGQKHGLRPSVALPENAS